ncbi:AEC family transporter [Bacillus shivajii]|uniref:AEC family transporter n=1 Tax=Bacillus shivajii TaxID=1983719 RepID=UPI001CF9D1B1|nr:AEC family transporter [Bacillus shivajii]UCZ54833.1 AEC family transporter [Bacillus shivajii]
MLFIEVVFPVVLVFIIGYIVQAWKKVNLTPISVVTIYILIPALVLVTLYEKELSIDFFYIVLYAFIWLFLMIIITKLYSKLMKKDENTESGLILSTAFMNAGNYGVPIILFAFGEAGFAYAIIFMVTQTIIMTIFGVYYAAKGGTGVRTAINTVMKMPATYTLILVIILQIGDIRIPEPLFNPIELISQAAIPVTMLLLGMQLAGIKLNKLEWSNISFAVSLRLIISPILAFGVTSLMPISSLMQTVLIIVSSMPTAATTTIYAIQFETKPHLVSSVTLISTICSVFTITFLLMLLV